MVNEAFRELFCSHTDHLLQILLPGARTELNLGSDMGFTAYNSVTNEKETMWRNKFDRAFRSAASEGAESKKLTSDLSSLEAVSSVDDATQLAKPLLTNIFSSLASRHNTSHNATNSSNKNFINLDLINLDKTKIKSAMQANVKDNQITNDIIGANEFVLGMKKFLADNAEIHTFFHFQVDVDFENERIFPEPDVEHFIDIINRTNLSVLYVLANFRPIDTHFSLTPYIEMAGGERIGGSEGKLHEMIDEFYPIICMILLARYSANFGSSLVVIFLYTHHLHCPSHPQLLYHSHRTITKWT